MDCKYANYLMMKYMDQLLSENEALSLNSHVSCCDGCKEDFRLYEYLIVEFEKDSACLFEPPDGFEERVMEKIEGIEPDYCAAYLNDMIIGAAVIVLSVFSALGVFATMYWAEFSEFFIGYPYVEAFMGVVGSVSDAVYDFIYTVSLKALYYTDGIFAALDAAKYVILAIVAGLAGAQCLVHSRSRIEI